MAKIQELFEAQNYKFKSREKNEFNEYLESTTAESVFDSASVQKGVIFLEQMSTAHAPALHNITVEGINLGLRMNTTYNEDPYIGYMIVNGETVPIPDKTDYQANWDEGIIDFAPYSLISNSTFSSLIAQQAIIQVDQADLELRSVSMSENLVTEARGSSIILASQSALKFVENNNFERN